MTETSFNAGATTCRFHLERAEALAALALQRALDAKRYIPEDMRALDTSVCDHAELHIDDAHDQEWCGWLTPAQLDNEKETRNA